MNQEPDSSAVEKQTRLDQPPGRIAAENGVSQLLQAVEAAGEVIFLTDSKGVFTYINAEFTRLYGFHADELVGKTTPRVLKSGKMTPRDYASFWERLCHRGNIRQEFINRTKDGRLVVVDAFVSPIVGEAGAVDGYMAIHHDVTLRKQADEAIRLRNKELAAINAVAASVSHSQDLNLILHRALDEILNLDISGERMYGMFFLLDETQQTLSLAAQRGIPEEHPCLSQPIRKGECLCGRALEQGEIILSQNSLEDERHTRRWAGMNPHKDICIPIQARGKSLGVMEIRMPLTYQLVENDLKLLKSVADQIGIAIENAQLRAMREHVVIEERERIARELHDGLSQLLGYVSIKAMAARLMLQKRQVKAASEQLLQLEEAARDVFLDVREAILGLRMAGQSNESLSDNLNEFIGRFTKMSGLPIQLSIVPEIDHLSLAVEIKYQLLRIVQEALNNVRKHAQASQVWVDVKYLDNLLEIAVSDDGIGFDRQLLEGNSNPGIGLHTMRERAVSIGATLQIDSSPNHGTCMRVRLGIRDGEG